MFMATLTESVYIKDYGRSVPSYTDRVSTLRIKVEVFLATLIECLHVH